jgi:hypothetical protein
MSFFLIVLPTLKYLPQMYWNYLRKSTVGWSIFNILMDITGGSLSFLQMFLEKMFGKDDIQFNYVKTLLGILCVIYDIIFILQHYVLYRKRIVRVQI